MSTAEKISPALKLYIAEAIQEALNDPDFGLELRPEFKKKLLALKRQNKGKRGISLEEIKRKYRL